MARTCQCSTCGRQFNVGDELTSPLVRCPSCQAEVKVSATKNQTGPVVVEPVENRAAEEEHIVTPAARHKVRRASSAMEENIGEEFWPAVPLPKGRATFAVAMLGVSALMDLVSIAAQFIQYLNLESAEQIPEDELDIFEILVGLTGLGQFLVYIITAVAFCMWFYRAYKNLKAWGIPGLKYSAGWAVGCFFIPILNLFRPYQIAQEIWKGSDPQVPLETGSQWRDNRGSSMIGAWWAFWLIANFAGQMTFRLSRSNNVDPGGLVLVSIIADLLSIIAAAFAILVVLRIQARQAQKLESIFAQAEGADSVNPEF